MDLENVKKCLRSVVLSEKIGVALRRLDLSYRDLIQEPIPYSRFGYKSLEEFLKSLKDTVQLKSINGEIYVTPVTTQETAHIEKLLKGQMRNKKITKPSKPPRPIQKPRHLFTNQTNGQNTRNRTAPRLMSSSRNKPLFQSNQSNSSVQTVQLPKSGSNLRQTSRYDLNMNQVSAPKTITTVINSNESALQRPKPILSRNSDQRTVNFVARLKTPISVTINSNTANPSEIQPKTEPVINDNNTPNKLSFKTLLNELALKENWEAPDYKSLGYQDKASKKFVYVARVKVANRSIVSHNTFLSPDDAEEEASKIAFEELKLRTDNKPITSEEKTIKESIVNKIISILSENALKPWFDNGLADEYTKRFKEALPANWIELIKDSNGLIEVEELKYSNVKKTLIALPNPKSKKRQSVSSTSSSPNLDEPMNNLIENSRTDSHEPQTVPKGVQLPDTETWDVIVTKVVNTCEVYVRLVEFSDEYAKCMNEMHAYYEAHPKPVNQVIEGKIYALKLSDATYRVTARSSNSDNTVKCILEDEGDVVEVSVNELHEIDSSFLKLSFQAFKCYLSGLEMYNENSVASNKLEELVFSLSEPVFVAVPISRDDPISIRLFDTTLDDSDRDINEELMQYLYQHCFDDLLATAGSQHSVCITHCTGFGDLYFQFDGKYYDTYDKLKNQVNQLCLSPNAVIPSMDILKEELKKSNKSYYFTQFDKDWCRVVITNVESSESIRVFYVDFGNDQLVSQLQIRSLESHLDPIISIPHLAVRCRLNVDIEWSDLVVDLFFDQFKYDDIMTIKIVTTQTSTNCATVEILDKVSSVNQRLVSAYKKATANTTAINGNNGVNQSSNNSEDKMLNALNICDNGSDDVIFGGKPIPKPILPAIKPNPQHPDDYFDVVVLLPATPSNFVVIPYANISPNSDFYRMKLRMHELYEKEDNRIELPHNVITKGLYCAGKYNRIWNRIQVKEIVNQNPFSVICLLVDYGDHQTFELKDIQPLYNEFRVLPIQAIKASLSTVEPIGNDWDVMASVEFRKMVENKAFVATIFGVKQVDGESVLQLSLCDTSIDGNDVYIGKSLAEKGLARLRISNI